MLSALAVLALSASVTQAGKRGLTWPWYNSELDPAIFNTNGEVIAIYDYETYAPPSSNTASPSGGLDFIGMQADMDSSSSPIADLATRASDQGWTTVFSLNEPDVNSISASDAASWYIEYINPLNMQRAFPSVSDSENSGEGLEWLSDFFTACDGECVGDFINIHWYGTEFSDFQDYVETAHNTFPDYDIVITEFALQNPSGGASDQLSFFTSAFAWLDEQDYVNMYFPFVTTTASLLNANDATAVSFVGTGACLVNDDGSLTDIGTLMVTA